jgi:hypothetical protein
MEQWHVAAKISGWVIKLATSEKEDKPEGNWNFQSLPLSGLHLDTSLSAIDAGYELLSKPEAMPCLRWLVAGLSLQRPGFAPGLFRVGFVMDEVAMG